MHHADAGRLVDGGYELDVQVLDRVRRLLGRHRFLDLFGRGADGGLDLGVARPPFFVLLVPFFLGFDVCHCFSLAFYNIEPALTAGFEDTISKSKYDDTAGNCQEYLLNLLFMSG